MSLSYHLQTENLNKKNKKKLIGKKFVEEFLVISHLIPYMSRRSSHMSMRTRFVSLGGDFLRLPERLGPRRMPLQGRSSSHSAAMPHTWSPSSRPRTSFRRTLGNEHRWNARNVADRRTAGIPGRRRWRPTRIARRKTFPMPRYAIIAWPTQYGSAQMRMCLNNWGCPYHLSCGLKIRCNLSASKVDIRGKKYWLHLWSPGNRSPKVTRCAFDSHFSFPSFELIWVVFSGLDRYIHHRRI